MLVDRRPEMARYIEDTRRPVLLSLSHTGASGNSEGYPEAEHPLPPDCCPRRPRFTYFLRSSQRPEWVSHLVAAFRGHKSELDIDAGISIETNQAPATVRPDLNSLGYEVEERGGEIPRPVLFGEGGELEKEYKIDAYHPENRVVLKVEAGRGAKGNAVYRDLIRMSLIVDAGYAAIAVPVSYRHKVNGRLMREPTCEKNYALLDAIFSNGRQKIPFQGIILIG